MIVGKESVIGPVGAPGWTVTVSLHRIGAADLGIDFTETVGVRALTPEGACLLAAELYDETIIDAAAWPLKGDT